MIIREASESVPRHMVHAGRPHPVARDEVLGLHSLPRLPGPFVNYNELTNDFAAHPGRSHSDSAEQHGFEQSAFSELPGKIVSRKKDLRNRRPGTVRCGHTPGRNCPMTRLEISTCL